MGFLVAVGPPEQVVKVLDTAFATEIEPAGLVLPRREPPLHGLADSDVLLLDLVAELPVALHRRRRPPAALVVVVELDDAALRASRQHAIDLQPPRKDVQHQVRIYEVVERLARAIQQFVGRE